MRLIPLDQNFENMKLKLELYSLKNILPAINENIHPNSGGHFFLAVIVMHILYMIIIYMIYGLIIFIARGLGNCLLYCIIVREILLFGIYFPFDS